jgi:endonuclease/exonuclease/phosphatase family metal-dependent hydrolase
MRITSWNFLHGQRLDPASTAELGEVLGQFQTDLISLQEVDHHLPRSGEVNQSREVADHMKAEWWGFAPAIAGTPGVKWRKLVKSEQRIITSVDLDEPGTSQKNLDGGNQSSRDRDGGDRSTENQYYGISIVSTVPVLHWHRLELGRSLVGMPLAIANGKGRPALIYVKDEPRVAIAAVLENGWIVINTHLSFVPLVNVFQLLKISRWVKKLESQYDAQVLLTGDFNLPWGIPSRLTSFKRATTANSYPSWKPAISFDYILTRGENLERGKEFLHPAIAISDHRPISVDIK